MNWIPGQLLESGKYKVVKQLGQGGFSQTYLVEDIYSKKLVVVKKSHLSFKNDKDYDDFLRRFQREGYILGKVSIPNIVRVIDFTNIEEVPCLIMEFVEGETLQDYVRRRGHIPEEEALRIFKTLAISLQALHEQGIIHCDIHPGNIIIKPNGLPTLIDFGSTKFIHPASWTVSATTNVFFSSYEQSIGKEGDEFDLQPSWDIYGLAATMFFAVTGQKPQGAISRKIYGDGQESPQELMPGLSNELNQFILKGIELESNDRPTSIKAWLDLLTMDSSSFMLRYYSQLRKRAVYLLIAGYFFQGVNLGSISDSFILAWPLTGAGLGALSGAFSLTWNKLTNDSWWSYSLEKILCLHVLIGALIAGGISGYYTHVGVIWGLSYGLCTGGSIYIVSVGYENIFFLKRRYNKIQFHGVFSSISLISGGLLGWWLKTAGILRLP
jgi:serine/threonine protein kinase